ncbi:succinylglutamate desuccinylase/aspartoacylase family protein [Parvularcula sp. LCG005]|uniref:succinylglutamate desuccinylase/aspartoacylase domain-containing protein n=1 Tax=Parvularcula sp. LCG005 TaxID=3078805 RepID=UPI00397BDBCF
MVEGRGDGPLVVLLAGLHGNEKNGVAVLADLFDDLDVEAGVVAGVLGNLPALAAHTRFVDRDMNRSFDATLKDRSDCEAGEARALLEMLDQLTTDYPNREKWLIDLHGTSGHAPPYLSICETVDTFPVAPKLPIPKVLFTPDQFPGTLVGEIVPKNWHTATFETGCLSAPVSVTNGVAVVRLILHELGVARLSETVIHRYHDALRAQSPTRALSRFTHRHIISDDDQFRMLPGFVSFQRIEKGEHLADDRNGAVLAPADGRIVMPLYQSKGQTGFYVAETF